MNGVYIRKLSLEELTERALPYMQRPQQEGGLPDEVARPLERAYTRCVLGLEQERLRTLGEAAGAVSFFYTETWDYEIPLIQKSMDAEQTRQALARSRALLADLEPWEQHALETSLRALMTDLDLKPQQFLGAIRVAVSGRKAMPPLFASIETLGRQRTLARIDRALATLR
jgi:glutamyl-tRNA synthetase